MRRSHRCRSSRSSARPAVGKTGVAIALAELLRERGEDPVAVSCDAIQVYRGLEIAERGGRPPSSGRGSSTGCSRFVDPSEEFSAGRYADARARARSTRCSPRGGGRSSSAAPASTCAPRSPTSTCGPPVPAEIRAEVERGARRAGPGGAARRARPGARRDGRSERPQADRPAHRAAARRDRAAARQRAALDGGAPPPDAAGRPDDGPRGARRADRRAGRRDGRRRRGRRGARGGRGRAPRGPPARRSASSELLGRRPPRRDEAAPTAPTRAASSPGCARCRASTLIDRTGRDDADVAAEIVAPRRLRLD